MRTASMVLGIIGGAICILYVLFIILMICFSTLAVPFPNGESPWAGDGINPNTANWLTQVIPIAAIGIWLLLGGGLGWRAVSSSKSETTLGAYSC